MKTKIPKCIKCRKPMRAIYTKRTYKYDNKYKTFWSKEGYICNHLNYPIVITEFDIPNKQKKFFNYLISVYDIDLEMLFKALNNIFEFYHLFFL